MAIISPGLQRFCMAALTAAVAFTASLSPAYSKAAALEFSPSHHTALRCSLAHAASSAAALPMAEMVAPDHKIEASQQIDVRGMKKGVSKRTEARVLMDGKQINVCHKAFLYDAFAVLGAAGV